MSGGGRGDRGNRHRSFKRRDREQIQQGSADKRERKAESRRNQDSANEKSRNGRERPQWIPPKMSSEPIPVPDCLYCGKPIKDLSVAISDKNTGKAVHFDCIISRISHSENLESGDIISYIGGGRFGIVRFRNHLNSQGFSIRKILEWEIRENRAEWRQTISDHFSVT